MTRYLVPFCLVLSPFLYANFAPLAEPDPPSLSSEFLGDAELAAGLAVSETNRSVLPFQFDWSENISTDAQPDGPVFLLSVIALPKPAEAEMSNVQSSIAYTPQQDPFNIWMPLGVGSLAVALIGVAGALRVRRTSGNRS